MKKSSYKVIGLMSGTSLDGLDIAYCNFYLRSETWNFELIHSKSIPYSSEWQKQLKNALQLSVEELLKLNITYGQFLGEQTKKFIDEHNLKPDFVASHGHTVYHQPDKGFTLQIGAGQELAIGSGKVVISDFRKKDVAFGGQGAPLVPIGDQLLYGKFEACLNLGGITNISFQENDKRVAFDIGFGNMLLNYLANQLGENYDDCGSIARSGIINNQLLQKLNSLKFFNKPYPKSLGLESFLSEAIPIIKSSNVSGEDKLATAVENISLQIGVVLEKKVKSAGEVLITGGGAFNEYLIERIKSNTSAHLNIITPDADTINFKEAIIFAFMGVLKMRGEINCLKSVTGATKNVSGGEVFYPT
jgi:anhydro-N-acetylmuramic acid kinase